MTKTQTVTGTMIDDHTVVLDESLDLMVSKVRVAIEPLTPPAVQCYRPDVVRQIHAAQLVRGYRPRSREEVDSSLAAERASWGD